MNSLFRKVQPRRISDEVAKQIEEAIIHRRLKPGNKLPAQKELNSRIQEKTPRSWFLFGDSLPWVSATIRDVKPAMGDSLRSACIRDLQDSRWRGRQNFGSCPIWK